jgi:hypothetical protein
MPLRKRRGILDKHRIAYERRLTSFRHNMQAESFELEPSCWCP